MEDNPIPDVHKTDHLILLVGSNPLPNYVAARLMSKPNTKLHLVISKEMHDLEVDQRLAGLLGYKPIPDNMTITVNPASPEDIFDQGKALVNSDPSGSWGLNYTGGKKSMAVHAYRAMEQTLKERGHTGVYSYLDADTQYMVIQTQNGRQERKKVDLAVNVTWEQILELHGRSKVFYGSKSCKKAVEPKEVPFHADFASALVSHCTQKGTWEQWKDFASCLKFSNNQTRIPTWVPMVGGLTIDELAKDWQSEIQALPDWEYSLIQNYVENEVDWIRGWLHGKWLEDYVLAEVLKVKDNCHLHQVVGSLQVHGLKQFEVDIVAMQGYQLYAISATTEVGKSDFGDKLQKQKLFEAITRARQMGGDEARVAMVTLSEKPQGLEKQVGLKLNLLPDDQQNSGQPDFLPQAEVFGVKHLSDLSNHLQNWFND